MKVVIGVAVLAAIGGLYFFDSPLLYYPRTSRDMRSLPNVADCPDIAFVGVEKASNGDPIAS